MEGLIQAIESEALGSKSGMAMHTCYSSPGDTEAIEQDFKIILSYIVSSRPFYTICFKKINKKPCPPLWRAGNLAGLRPHITGL